MSRETAALTGVLTALATPFDREEEIDFGLLDQVVDRSIDGGVDALVAGGSTAEFASLSSVERARLTEAVVNRAGGRVPVVAQTGATTVREAIRLSRQAQESGADVLMLVTPYYEPLTVEETTAYLREVIDAVELPVMLYNIPAATGVHLPVETVSALAEESGQVRYIKDSSADWEYCLQLIRHLGDRIGTFVGWDAYIFDAFSQGAAGVMAGAANVIPEQLVAVRDAFDRGDLAAAQRLWQQTYPTVDAMLSSSFVPAVRAGLKLQGLDIGPPRRPLAPLSGEDLARLDSCLSALTVPQ